MGRKRALLRQGMQEARIRRGDIFLVQVAGFELSRQDATVDLDESSQQQLVSVEVYK
jgi:hypothetical protein